MVTSPKELSKAGSKICRAFYLGNQAKMQRFYSGIHLCHSVNRVHASNMEPKLKNCWPFEAFKFHLPGSLLPKSLPDFSFEPETSEETNVADDPAKQDEMEVEAKKSEMYKREDWLKKILQIRTLWIRKQQRDELDNDSFACEGCDIDGEMYDADYCDDEVEGNEETDRETFSNMLKDVSWSDTKLFLQSAFLCNMSYAISEIMAADLRRHFGLKFVTSSLEKKSEAVVTKATFDQDFIYPQVNASPATEFKSGKSEESDKKCLNNQPSVAYDIATAAASYVRSRAKDLSLLDSEQQDEENSMALKSNESKLVHKEERSAPRVYKTEVQEGYITTTMTPVIATSEKEEASMALQSLQSSPCKWFVCDDSSTLTRFFVIQGSDSLASWQSNLLFEPTVFEGTDVLVHRGVYEAAKRIYEQLKPVIMEHLDKYGEGAKLSFTGHCFGGSVSLLVNLMLLTRKVVKPSALRPVVTFGSPFVLCGGQKILDALGLNEDHVHCVIMHRDIVPRAFSCNYPDHIAQMFKLLHGSFCTHPCLIKNKLMYAPMGKTFILQPSETLSPSHPLLPSGIALYALENPECCSSKNPLMTFLNAPHPLETLSNITSYGSNGTILRDHDSSNYLKAVNGVLRQHTKAVKQTARRQRSLLWPILTSQSPHAWGSCQDDK
ncbi:hypothetical protein AgCh_016443 [Apium graveolens]